MRTPALDAQVDALETLLANPGQGATAGVVEVEAHALAVEGGRTARKLVRCSLASFLALAPALLVATVLVLLVGRLPLEVLHF